MKVIETAKELQSNLQPSKENIIGFVPTMGYLHEGHLSLVKRAKKECDIVVMSIFVNPLQFGPNEDFSRYPRDMERDLVLAKRAGVDILFHPSIGEMNGEELLVTVKVSGISDVLCGENRPGHIDGVATIVAKLFHQVQPDRAYFGLKDAQQVAVISQMVRDLSFPVTIVPCVTVREEDGLALSSRNVYLSKEERAQAVILSQALVGAKQGLLEKRWNTADEVNNYIRTQISTQPSANIQYIKTLTYPYFKEPTSLCYKQMIIALAVYFGPTRLIDNLLFQAEGDTVVSYNDEI
jgi:pantoate--beta-alanine ligase